MLTPPLKGFYQVPLGKFYSATLEGLHLCLGHIRESVGDTGFTWDLVDDPNSWRSLHDNFWSTEGCF